jgi:Icc-related predicted phosphoesterase
VGSIKISALKSKSAKTPLYSYGVLTDVHFGVPKIDPANDFKRALAFFAEEGASMVCICGDISEYGTEEEFQAYANAVAQSKIPVYTTTGNHDCPSSGGLNSSDLVPYTGQEKTFELTYVIGGKNVHFIFLGMNMYSLGDTGVPYLDSDIEWLENKLEE